MAAQEVGLITIESSDRGDTYHFERPGDEFPLVDVSIFGHVMHERRRIVTDGPFRLQPTSPGSKSAFRVRPQGSPRSEFAVSVAEDRVEEVASWIAKLVFEINDNREVNGQEQE